MLFCPGDRFFAQVQVGTRSSDDRHLDVGIAGRIAVAQFSVSSGCIFCQWLQGLQAGCCITSLILGQGKIVPDPFFFCPVQQVAAVFQQRFKLQAGLLVVFAIIQLFECGTCLLYGLVGAGRWRQMIGAGKASPCTAVIAAGTVIVRYGYVIAFGAEGYDAGLIFFLCLQNRLVVCDGAVQVAGMGVGADGKDLKGKLATLVPADGQVASTLVSQIFTWLDIGAGCLARTDFKIASLPTGLVFG